MKYSINQIDNDDYMLMIHPKNISRLGINLNKQKIIRFGLLSVPVRVVGTSEIAANEIVISRSVIDVLKIPLCAQYELLLKGNEILIGPYIGIHSSASMKELQKDLKILSGYVKEYEKIGGAVLVFSKENVNRKELTIEGFIFSPKRNTWDKGIYPYPSAIFKRKYLDKRWTRHFQKVIGSRIFNSGGFNKWQTYRKLSKFKQIKPYMPETNIYHSQDNIKDFLNNNDQVYIKPIYGNSGKGILTVSKKGDGITVNRRINRQNEEMYFPTAKESVDFLRNHLKSEKYIFRKQ